MERIIRLWIGLRSRIDAALLRARGARINGHVWLQGIDVPRNARDIWLGDGAALDRGVTLIATGIPGETPRIRIGKRCYINRFAILDASGSIEVGDDCLIGPYCYLTDHDHELDRDPERRKSGLRTAPTRLEPGVWLGARVTVLKGVTIGTGTVVGAGSVVTHDLPADCLALGTPARVVRQLTSGESPSSTAG